MTETQVLTPTALYTVAVPLIVSLTQIFKGIAPGGWWKYSPLVAIALGFVVSIGTAQAFPQFPDPWILTGLKGLGIGLAASGLYSGSKTLGMPMPGPGAKA